MNLDFEGLARELLSQARVLLPQWLPEGKLVGKEFTVGSLHGEAGTSLKINVDNGVWADFATGDKGGDLINLFAAIHGLSQGDAAKRLADSSGYNLGGRRGDRPKQPDPLPIPPAEIQTPTMTHSVHGKPSATWRYNDAEGGRLFYVARYDTKEGKEFAPWSWSPAVKQFVMKAFPSPRPLYRLSELNGNPDKPILIVEGEKAADAAHRFAGNTYVVVTWSGGALAHGKTDFTPLHGRAKILLWPDADEPGRRAMSAIGDLLLSHVGEVKILSTDDLPSGYDAADFSGQKWSEFAAWAKPRASIYTRTVEVLPTLESSRRTLDVTVTVGEDGGEVPPSTELAWSELGLARANNRIPITSMNNVVRVLEGWPSLTSSIWFDEFHQRYFTEWATPGKPREWADIDDLNLTNYIQGTLGLQRIGLEAVKNAVRLYAHRFVRNEPRDWMETLKWDEVPRLQSFFADVYGTPENEYTQAIGRNFWIGMVARVYQPGCKLDNMVILEGLQDAGKSTSLGIIGGKWFAESHQSPENKDFYLNLHGKIVIEIGELDAFRKVEDTLIKRLLSCSTDRYRTPYDIEAQDHPRRCIFVGTTNEDSYLKDHTGARRFWPVKVEKVDLSYLRGMRDQFFAEAIALYKHGATWWEVPRAAAVIEQEARRDADEWESMVQHYLIGKNEVGVLDIAVTHLKIEPGKFDKRTQMRLAKILKQLGWERKLIRTGTSVYRQWVKPKLQ